MEETRRGPEQTQTHGASAKKWLRLDAQLDLFSPGLIENRLHFNGASVEGDAPLPLHEFFKSRLSYLRTAGPSAHGAPDPEQLRLELVCFFEEVEEWLWLCMCPVEHIMCVSCINPPPSAQRCGAVTSHRLLRQTGTVFFEVNVACDDATQR